MDLPKALEYLNGLALKAAAPQTLAETPRDRRVLVGGEVVLVPRDVPPRDHAVGCLDDLVALANRFHDGGKDTPAVWYDEERVVLVIDDGGHRCERATLALETSDAFAVLARLRRERPWYDPKPFHRLLRVELAGAAGLERLAEAAGRLRFENGQTVTAENARGKESLGRSITSQVTGEKELPEEVTVGVPVYKTHGERDLYPVRCAVEPDALAGKIQLIPFPDEIERVRQLAVASVAARLRQNLNETVPAYYGRP